MSAHNATPDDIAVENIRKTYRGSSTPANDGITLTFSPGEVIALIGHNGAGKTTLLGQMSGLVAPDSGSIRYRDRDLTRDPSFARTVTAMMPQAGTPLTGVTPLQAVTSIGRIRGYGGPAARRAAGQLVDALDIGDWATTRGDRLSGGIRRLTCFAMATIAPPPVLLIDEPTNDVDPTRRPLVWRHLRALADDGHVVIVVTHNLNEVQETADRAVLLHHGRVRLDTTSAELAADSDTRSVRMTVRTRNPTVRAPAPWGGSCHTDDGALVVDVDPADLGTATAWATALVRSGEAEGYSVSPASTSLESTYRRLTDDH
ncbi:ABC transporter ATP-binding protein [Corynebacterium bovis]|uniref:ABC transporter ATP-binding protein n=1 Tax=Corynebacterium bovis TaxID=36808 RepID=UPI00244B8882|nr:ABC transporter ATP-binding protein [Corynebacterium bovis]MDH2456202.1 ABC transporter ATP-binding protein [Corynebacterium bovis]